MLNVNNNYYNLKSPQILKIYYIEVNYEKNR